MKASIVAFTLLLSGVGMLLSTQYTMALEMSDFLPGFLINKKNQSNTKCGDNSINNAANKDNDTDKVNLEYCRDDYAPHIASNASSKNNGVDKIDLSNSLYVKSNNLDNINNHSTTTQNSSSVIVNNGTTFVKTDANQMALQDPSTKAALDKYQGAFLLPIQPQKDVKMNINDKQIQVDIKY